MDDLAEVVEAFASPYILTRHAPGTYLDGRLVPGAETPAVIQAVVQPLTGRDLMRLEEGLRTQELRKVWSRTELKTQAPGQDPDTIQIGPDFFQIEKVYAWGDLGNYFEAIVAKIGR